MPINLTQLRSTWNVSQQPPGYIVKGYGDESYAGETVTVEGALSVAAVLSAFTILMEDTASLPLMVYKRLERGKERDVNNPMYLLLHDEPNPEHTSMVYREFVMGHLLGWGNHYSQKIWDRRGVLRELWPLRPDRMKVVRVDGQRQYIYTEVSGKTRRFRQEEIWHVPAFGFDGLIGYSRITLARHAIGLAIATEKFGSKLFANGTNPGVIYKHPGQLKQEAFDRLKESIEQNRGAENAHQTVILEEGMSIEKLGIPPDDAQFIETRKFQLGEIARMFRVPPHLIGDMEKSTSWGSGIEQQELGYLSHTLRPWLVRIEQGAHKDLLLQDEKKNTVIEHLTEAFLRTDIAARMAAYVQAIQNGVMTRNEARERENLNPIDGLDEVLMPLNMTTVTDAEEDDAIDDEAYNNDGMDSVDSMDSQNDPTSEPAPRMSEFSGILEPFVRDMAQRIMRREAKEVVDASKRWLDKGKSERFIAWLEAFYRQDHAEFMLRTLEPLTKIDPKTVKNAVESYLKTHGAQVFRAFNDGDELSLMMDEWLKSAPGALCEDLLGSSAEITANRDRYTPTINVTVNNQPIPATVVNVDNRAEPAPMNFTVNVEPTPLEIINQVQTPVVNVAAPNVDVTNEVQTPIVNVAAADVTVNVPEQPAPDVIVNVPKNKSVSVKRGRDGRISGLEADA